MTQPKEDGWGRFNAISALDARAYGAASATYELLDPYLSSQAVTDYRVRVELEHLRALAVLGVVDASQVEALAAAAKDVTAGEVEAAEVTTRHDVGALVQVLRARGPGTLARFIHLGLTGNDVVDTANALRFRECIDAVVAPAAAALADAWDAAAKRVDGDLREVLAAHAPRLRTSTEQLHGTRLPGKLSGAVGTYAAIALFVHDPREHERVVLRAMSLEPAPASTQIVNPEGWADLAHGCIAMLGIVASAAANILHAGAPGPTRTGVVLQLWRDMIPRVITTYADQISEHQRDLTNSASQRFSGEILAGLTLALAYAHDDAVAL